jgi:signal transduction histidine kinase
MRERIEAHGGTLEAANRPEGGFGMQIRLPRSGDAQ